jgi:hypothetical protein
MIVVNYRWLNDSNSLFSLILIIQVKKMNGEATKTIMNSLL